MEINSQYTQEQISSLDNFYCNNCNSIYALHRCALLLFLSVCFGMLFIICPFFLCLLYYLFSMVLWLLWLLFNYYASTLIIKNWTENYHNLHHRPVLFRKLTRASQCQQMIHRNATSEKKNSTSPVRSLFVIHVLVVEREWINYLERIAGYNTYNKGSIFVSSLLPQI
jgi:hypothetical protein